METKTIQKNNPHPALAGRASKQPKTSVGRAGKIFRGTVVTDAMDKTIVVEVVRYVKHPKYGKYMKRKKRYSVHDPENTYTKGDTVSFRETTPISKTKRFEVIDAKASVADASNPSSSDE